MAMRILALIVVLAGCGDGGGDGTAPTPTLTATPTPTATPFDSARFAGVYSGTVGGSDGFATISGGISIELMKEPHSTLSLGGALRSDGTAEIRGDGVFQDDIFVEASGRLTVTEADGVQRIVGTIDAGSLGAASFSPFLLERPVEHDASVFAGAYRFTFTPSASGCECTTTATFTFAVDADGFASSTATAAELDESSRKVGSFEPGACFVGATGRARCTLGYSATFVSPPGEFFIPPSDLGLTVQLLRDRGLAFGTSEPSIFSSFLGGTVTIERTSD